jgi:hypothetical protein
VDRRQLEALRTQFSTALERARKDVAIALQIQPVNATA